MQNGEEPIEVEVGFFVTTFMVALGMSSGGMFSLLSFLTLFSVSILLVTKLWTKRLLLSSESSSSPWLPTAKSKQKVLGNKKQHQNIVQTLTVFSSTTQHLTKADCSGFLSVQLQKWFEVVLGQELFVGFVNSLATKVLGVEAVIFDKPLWKSSERCLSSCLAKLFPLGISCLAIVDRTELLWSVGLNSHWKWFLKKWFWMNFVTRVSTWQPVPK